MSTKPDQAHFLVAFPIFPVDRSGMVAGSETEGRHFLVRNAVTGIGIPLSDGGQSFGSQERLKAFVDLYALVPGGGQGFEATLAVVAHEIAHQWSGAALFRDSRTNQTSDALLGLDGAHWSYYLDSDASVLYGADWLAGASQSFSAIATIKRYSALDLYLMGFLAPDELGPIALLQPSPIVTPAASLPPAVGTRISATPLVVTAADLVAAMGPRAPASSQAEATFRAAFVIVAAPGQEPTPEQVEFVDEVRREWANRFFFMTRGRAVMQTELLEAGRPSPSSHPSVAAGLDYLLARQQADGSWADDLPTTVRETGAAVQALAIFGREARIGQALSAAQAWLLQGSGISENDSLSRRARGLPSGRMQHTGSSRWATTRAGEQGCSFTSACFRVGGRPDAS